MQDSFLISILVMMISYPILIVIGSFTGFGKKDMGARELMAVAPMISMVLFFIALGVTGYI